ncbi:hypothetical protein K3495_g13040 [Podosphaera aphanis]|nr:hypothetical protein K3495_g13040 [Podosphaera aphanis]
MSAAEILKSMKGAPKLEKSTYNRWSTHFLDTLSLFEVDSYILESKSQLNGHDKKVSEADLLVQKQDKHIRIAMSQLVPDIAFHLVNSSYSSKTCWDNLKQFYRPDAADDVDELLQEYWGLNFEDDIEVDESVQKLSEIRAKICLIDRNLAPSDTSMKKRILSHFIKCCGGFYMSTVISLRDPTITLQSAVASIRASQAVYRDLHPTPVVALVDMGNNYSSAKSAEVKRCAHCERRGHLRESCFLWLDTADGSKWASKNPEKAAKARKLQAKIGDRKIKGKINANHVFDDDSTESDAWIMEEQVLMAPKCSKGGDVVLDTGATNHIFHDKSRFLSISPCDKSVLNASGQSIPVSGIGKVQFRVFDFENENSSKVITMENVLFVPSCTKNLVSGIQLLSRGFGIRSMNGGLSILSGTGSIIATARPEGGLFCFNTSSSSYPAPPTHFLSHPNSLILQDTRDSAVGIMHRRFAHVGPQALGKFDVSEFKIPGFKSTNAQDFRIAMKSLKSCDVCNSCKQVERINRGPVPGSSGILDLVHSDTWGKCRIPGIYGSLYFVTFTDDYTRESEVHLMKSKMDVPSCFRLYKAKKERQSGRLIKAMRFDGGSEYKTIDFCGITQQVSAPYTQHQNGVAERLNRTLITMARCMLSQARLPSRFWDAAVVTACYLRNRLPLRQDNLTSFEAMNGCSPGLSHLKVWGCICYALIDDKDPQRFKLSPTSHKGIFVGYCESSTQYRVYVPSKPGANKIITSANVRFLEDSFWDWKGSPSISFDQVEVPISAGQTQPELESDSDEDFGAEIDVVPSNDLSSISPAPVESSQPAVLNDNIADSPSSSSSIPEVDVSSLRRSNRIPKPIAPRSAWQPRTQALNVREDISVPQSYSEAVNGPERDQWKVAIDDELSSLEDKGVFKPITHIPHGRKPIGSRWVFTVKSDGRFKARLVAKGFSQVPGIDYFDTYAPTLRMDSLRILLAVSAFRDWEIHQIDVKTAYLEGDLHEEIFMKCPEGMLGTKFVRLEKSLYGLKQSGRAWNEKLDMKLCALGLKKSEYDHCIYIHPRIQIVIGVYVDDLVICGKNINQVVEIKEKLSACFPIKCDSW